MTKQFWINLPVKDVSKSRDFFTQLGFSFNRQHGDSTQNASLSIGDNKVNVMLFAEPLFKGFVGNANVDTNNSSEVLFSIDAESPEEVDELANKVRAAGGRIYGEPGYKDGWMYGCGFVDLDDHRWNVLYMDMSKMPGQ